MTAANKLGNCYVDELETGVYADIPKAVWAAIAISALTCGGDLLDEATSRVIKEWKILHGNGIVPQEPSAKMQALITHQD